ncbi:MAG: hypothetical protein AB7O43_07120 [Hyphomicrobiaceae bacterium]
MIAQPVTRLGATVFDGSGIDCASIGTAKAAGKWLALSIQANLVSLRCVDSLKPYPRLADPDCVALGHNRNILKGCSGYGRCGDHQKGDD